VVDGVLTIPLAGKTLDSAHLRDAAAARAMEFVAGTENVLAATALTPFIQRASTAYSPLLLYGPHGSGKSHLACGLAEWWRHRFPEARVLCVWGAEFARQHIAALGTSRLEAWRDEVRGANLFVLEDLGQLTGKAAAQRELAQSLDALAEADALAIVTARTLPTHWLGLYPGLRSRLSAGLAVGLSLPGWASRREIVKRLAAARGIGLSKRSLDCLANALSGSVPALIGTMLQLDLAGNGHEVDSQRVRQLLAETDGAGPPSLREIGRLTARYFGLRLSDLKSPLRRRSLVTGRGVAMYLARRLTGNSLGQIGDFFGDRDHATVLHGCRRIEKLLAHDRAIRQAVSDLENLLLQ